MIKRLKNRPRLDTLRSEKRRRKGSVGRWIYLALLCFLAWWLFDLALGNVLFFRAEGFVTRTRYQSAAPFVAQVAELYVDEGEEVQAGQRLARLHSPEISRDIAQLAIRIADLEIRMTELRARNEVLGNVLPFAEKRAAKADSAMKQIDSSAGKALATSQRVSSAAKEEFESMERLAEISTEHATLSAQLAQLEQALERARQAYATTVSLYSGGEVRAAVAGTIADIPVAVGGVAKEGEPLLEILTGPRFIHAYASPGGLYRIERGEPVVATYGLQVLRGEIQSILPISANLPQEFQRAFRPKDRAQLIRIGIREADRSPPLLTKVEVTRSPSLKAWLLGRIGSLRD